MDCAEECLNREGWRCLCRGYPHGRSCEMTKHWRYRHRWIVLLGKIVSSKLKKTTTLGPYLTHLCILCGPERCAWVSCTWGCQGRLHRSWGQWGTAGGWRYGLRLVVSAILHNVSTQECGLFLGSGGGDAQAPPTPPPDPPYSGHLFCSQTENTDGFNDRLHNQAQAALQKLYGNATN